MMLHCCPVRGCGKQTPKGTRTGFCVDCYFKLPKGYVRLITQTSIAAERATSDSDREHLRDQHAAYVRTVIRIMGWEAADAA